MPLIDHPTGNYRFLPGIAPYSCGVIAKDGFEIVHVTFRVPVPYRKGFDGIAEFLNDHGSKSSLCAVELRSPQPFSFAGFAAFNAEYTSILRGWDLFVGDQNPVARTNVAPVLYPPDVPSLYGFSFTRRQVGDAVTTFVVAGGGELPEGKLSRDDIVALGDTSTEGMAIKSQFVMYLMETRLTGLGVDWTQVTQINVYTKHSLTPLIDRVILSRTGPGGIHGATWHYSRPPIDEIEFEMDVRGTMVNLML